MENKLTVFYLLGSCKIRSFLIFSIVVMLPTAISCKQESPVIEEIAYKGTDHFRIETENATWYLEKQSGGFSSVLDKSGTDWIQFRKSDSVSVPESAASDFRGLPNLVHRGKQSGIGHPGFDKCTSTLLNDSTILTESKNSNYAFTWTFHQEYAEFKLLRADTSRNYWFLYEGTIGGHFKPADHLCFTDQGFQAEKPPISGGNYIADNFQWVAFGDVSSSQLFFVKHLNPDKYEDVIMYMGASPGMGNESPDGMVVMGFGRDDAHQPLMQEVPNSFRVGFLNLQEKPSENSFEKIKVALETN